MKQAGETLLASTWRMDLADACALLGPEVGVQGNLDPITRLFAPPEVIEDKVEAVLAAAAGRNGHIFNLGHGVLPETPPENVAVMVNADPSQRTVSSATVEHAAAGGPLAVLVLAYGGPKHLDEVKSFLDRVLAPRVPDADMVGRALRPHRLIGGASPLAENTFAQASALDAYLRGPGAAALTPASGGVDGMPAQADAPRVGTFVGMRFTEPSIHAAVAGARLRHGVGPWPSSWRHTNRLGRPAATSPTWRRPVPLSVTTCRAACGSSRDGMTLLCSSRRWPTGCATCFRRATFASGTTCRFCSRLTACRCRWGNAMPTTSSALLETRPGRHGPGRPSALAARLSESQ